MTVRVEKTELPGVGVRHDVITHSGRRLGVIMHRTGERELAFFDQDDPDSCRDSISLEDDEAIALSEVLGSSLILGQLNSLGDKATGLFTEQIVLPAHSPFAGKKLGATKARTLTKASIVALLRGTQVIPSPGPEDALEAGDIVVAVGTHAGLETLSTLLANGRP